MTIILAILISFLSLDHFLQFVRASFWSLTAMIPQERSSCPCRITCVHEVLPALESDAIWCCGAERVGYVEYNRRRKRRGLFIALAWATAPRCFSDCAIFLSLPPSPLPPSLPPSLPPLSLSRARTASIMNLSCRNRTDVSVVRGLKFASEIPHGLRHKLSPVGLCQPHIVWTRDTRNLELRRPLGIAHSFVRRCRCAASAKIAWRGRTERCLSRSIKRTN